VLLARGHATLTALQGLREDRALRLGERLRTGARAAR
jgi:hypothetical protein